EDYDNEVGPFQVMALRPRAIFPAPPIITLPHETPVLVKGEIELAFQLFWADLGSCVSRLRASVEHLLDEFKIPRNRIDKKSNKRVYLPLAARIQMFEQRQARNKEFADFLDALRHVGNLGTHSEVSRQAVLAGFDIYEIALSEIFGKRSKKLKALVKEIIKK